MSFEPGQNVKVRFPLLEVVAVEGDFVVVKYAGANDDRRERFHVTNLVHEPNTGPVIVSPFGAV
jgi:hypothetical protein